MIFFHQHCDISSLDDLSTRHKSQINRDKEIDLLVISPSFVVVFCCCRSGRSRGSMEKSSQRANHPLKSTREITLILSLIRWMSRTSRKKKTTERTERPGPIESEFFLIFFQTMPFDNLRTRDTNIIRLFLCISLPDLSFDNATKSISTRPSI